MKQNKKNSLVGFLSVLMLTILLVGCGQTHKKAIQIKGSDTMVNLGQAWAESYMKKSPLTNLAVTGGGSGTGIASIIAGSADIAQSSRDMEPKELAQARSKGIEPKEIKVANDGVAVVVNPANPVQKLTIAQLSDIFTGKIKNWKQVGGSDLKITALSRERNSGTHVYFLEAVVKKGNKKNPEEYSQDVLMMPSSQAIIEEVAVNPSAIGYVGMGYLTAKEKVVSVSKGSGKPYVYPTVKSVLAKQYPISRSLNFYVNGIPTGDIKEFVDFVLSKEGQDIVLKMDFVPIK